MNLGTDGLDRGDHAALGVADGHALEIHRAVGDVQVGARGFDGQAETALEHRAEPLEQGALGRLGPEHQPARQHREHQHRDQADQQASDDSRHPTMLLAECPKVTRRSHRC